MRDRNRTFAADFRSGKSTPQKACDGVRTAQSSRYIHTRRRRMTFVSGEIDPSQSVGAAAPVRSPAAPANQVTFSRRELRRILDLYGRKVAAGEWRDYAIDFL